VVSWESGSVIDFERHQAQDKQNNIIAHQQKRRIKLKTSKTAKQHHRSSTKETNKSNYNYLASLHRSNSVVETERINC
jgi:hypothetical protein